MKTTTTPVLNRICTQPYSSTPAKEPFKPGDDVQFKVETLRGHGWFLGQIWSFAPVVGTAGTYWVVDDRGQEHQVHREDLRLANARSTHSPELAKRDGRTYHHDFMIEVA